jgi:hypothetical protein
MDASGARQLARVGVSGLLAVVGALVVAPQALALTSVTVTVTGPGTVTAPAGTVSGDGINCTQSGTTADCSETYPQHCQIVDRQLECTPAEVTLSANTPSGFHLSWSGCDSDTADTCTLTVDGDRAVGAVFNDTQPPMVSLTSPSGGAVRGTISLAANAIDNAGISRVDFSVRGAPVLVDGGAPYGGPFDTTTVSDGPAAIQAVARDTSNLVSAPSGTTVTIDNTAPQVSLTGPDGQAFGPGSTQTWGITATDPTSGVWLVRCSVVPAGHALHFDNCTGGNTSHSVSNEPVGNYVFTVQVIDVAGNVRDVSRTFSIDATPPDTTIASGPDDGSSQESGTATFGFTSDDSGASFGCRVYAAGTTPPPFAACSDPSSDTISGLGIGTYRFDVRAVDAAGNVDATPATRTFSVVAPSTEPTTPTTPTTPLVPTLPAPATAPDTLIDSHPKTAVKNKRASFHFSSTDPAAAFECSLDGAAFSACSTPFTVKVKPGKHVFAVRAVGANALTDQTPALWQWKVKRKHRRHHGHHG